MAEALTIALLLEAKDNASEWIDRVKENVDKLAKRAEEASKTVADSADQMTTSLEKTDVASNGAADAVERDTVATREMTRATRDQALATDENTSATDKETIATEESSKAMETSTEKTGLLAGASKYLMMGLLGVAAVSVKMAMGFQNSTATLAGQAGITEQAAQKIGNAFLKTGGQTTFTASEMMTAFSPIAGEFVNMYGHALSAAQAVTFMNAAMTLAEASGGDLTTTTKALADIMMVFHLKVNQAAGAANTMFNAQRLLGVSGDGLAQTLTRLEPKIAGSGMTLAQLSGFMVELSKSAGGGRQAMRMAGTVIQGLVTPSSTAQKTLAALGIELTNSRGKFIGINAAIGKLHDAMARLPGVTKDVKAMQEAYRLQVQLSTLGLEPQTKALKKQETALSTQISALNQSSKAFSQTSVMQALFGKSAGMVAGIVANGLPAYHKSVIAVTKEGEAAKAAAEKQKTFEGEMKKLKAAAESIFIELGQKLLPVLTHVAEKTLTIVNHIIDWVQHNQTLAKWIGIAVIAIYGFVTAAKVAKAVTEAWAVMQGVLDAALDANPIGLAIVAILALALAATYVTTHLRQIGHAAMVAWNDFANAWNGASAWFNAHVVQAIANLVVALWRKITSGAADAWNGVKRAWDAAASWFNTAVIGPVKRTFDAVWGAIKTAAADAWRAVSGVWDAVASWFNTNVIQPVERFFKALWGATSSGATTAWNGVMGVWNAVASWFNTNVIQPIENFFKALWSKVVGGAEAAVNTVKGVFHDVTSVFGDITGGIVSGFDAVKGAVTGATNSVKTMKTTVDGTVKAVKELSTNAQRTRIHTPTSTVAQRNIHHLATGGMVTSPTLAIVGEAGPELVLPLSGLPGGAGAIRGGISPLPTSAPARGDGSSGGTIIQIHLTMSGQVYGDLNHALNAMGRQLATVLVPGSGTRLTAR